jgi:HAD superfamily hydrolase (TIGR01490 family)
MHIAVFDLDGTLYTGHLTYGLSAYLLRVCPRPGRLALFWARQLLLYPAWHLHWLPEEEVRERGLRLLAALLKGLTAEQVEPMAAWVARHYVAKRWRRDVLQQLWRHQRQGDRVIVVSGTPQPLLPPIADLLEIKELLGTKVEVSYGQYTGQVYDPVCQGAGKVARLQEYLSHEGPVPWQQMVAYADSYTDLPLLVRAGTPVAVHADEQLAAHARTAGWSQIPLLE